MLWSADVQPIGQGTNGLSHYLLADQDFIFLCVYYTLYGSTRWCDLPPIGQHLRVI